MNTENRNSTVYRDIDGRLHVKNISAYWIPDFKLKREIGGTVYSITGSYDGIETLDKTLTRIFARNCEDDNHDK